MEFDEGKAFQKVQDLMMKGYFMQIELAVTRLLGRSPTDHELSCALFGAAIMLAFQLEEEEHGGKTDGT